MKCKKLFQNGKTMSVDSLFPKLVRFQWNVIHALHQKFPTCVPRIYLGMPREFQDLWLSQCLTAQTASDLIMLLLFYFIFFKIRKVGEKSAVCKECT
jgi:hypothetical protein